MITVVCGYTTNSCQKFNMAYSICATKSRATSFLQLNIMSTPPLTCQMCTLYPSGQA